MKTYYRVSTSYRAGSNHYSERMGRWSFAELVRHFTRTDPSPVTITLTLRDGDSETVLDTQTTRPLTTH